MWTPISEAVGGVGAAGGGSIVIVKFDLPLHCAALATAPALRESALAVRNVIVPQLAHPPM